MSVFIKCGHIRQLEGEEVCAKARSNGQGKMNFGQRKVSEMSGNFISD